MSGAMQDVWYLGGIRKIPGNHNHCMLQGHSVSQRSHPCNLFPPTTASAPPPLLPSPVVSREPVVAAVRAAAAVVNIHACFRECWRQSHVYIGNGREGLTHRRSR